MRFVQPLGTCVTLLYLSSGYKDISNRMRNMVSQLVDLLRSTASLFWVHGGMQKSAALAYYTLFALPGLLLITLSVASVVFDATRVQQQVLETLGSYLGNDAAGTIQAIIEHVLSQTADLSLATTGGVLALLFGATGAFVQLQTTLNEIWGVEAGAAKDQIRQFVKKRVLSFVLLLGMGLLLIVSLVSRTVVSMVNVQMERMMAESMMTDLIATTEFVIFFLLTALLIAVLFKVLPDVKISWANVVVASLVTAAGFTVGKLLLSLYFTRSSVGSAFGAASSLAVILIWIYFSGIILFAGAAFSRVWVERNRDVAGRTFTSGGNSKP